MTFRVVVGSDAAGFEYKEALRADLEADDRIESVQDVGVFADARNESDYPAIGIAAGQLIAAGRADRAVLVCGTGIGVAIAANKVPGIRATVAHDSFSVERSILSNDAQVMTVGQRVIGLQLARRLVHEWFDYTFDRTSPSDAKVGAITEFERRV